MPARRLPHGLFALAALLVTLVFPQVAEAHYPTISARVACPPGATQLQLSYTSTSWVVGPGGANTQVTITVNGVQVDQEPYAPPSYSFSGTVPAPAGDSAIVTAIATGQWEQDPVNGQSDSIEVSYPEAPCGTTALGRFTGGFIVGQGRDKVTGGLTIHCDLRLSNNLEINWGGHRFHMTEHLSTTRCSDDPAIQQAPPTAPIDTLSGVATGRYDGRDGYTIVFTLVDSGEPGRQRDQIALYIYQTANPSNVVLNLAQVDTSGGNLQAHADQPHRVDAR